MSGWIKLHRSICENPYWLDGPFSRGQAWVDLILHANSKDGYIRKQGVKIPLSRGDVGESENTLSSRWGWSRGKVRRFLEELENDKMISRKQSKKTDKRTFVISILKYNDFQNKSDVGDTSDSTGDSTSDGQATVQEQEGKKERSIIIEYSKEYSCRDDASTAQISDQDQDQKTPKPDPIPYAKIIAHLNQKCGCQFKASNQTTKNHIKARWNEGYRLEDFIAVIDFKFAEWAGDEKMCRFIRPQTLFGTKFESYLVASKKNEVNGREIVKKDDIKLEVYSKTLSELLKGESPFVYANREGLDALRRHQATAQEAATRAGQSVA